MVNKASHADHVPMRSCVICRQKKEKNKLIRFGILEKNIVYDLKNRLQTRGHYVCDDNNCIKKLKKWLAKK